ncbi:MAG: nitroreductase family protein [Deltaproteobacteria bacterium]|uniref:Nitroreductase family protein n=1 Tax=Candidatus Zymogenus saltonus TaxID=2844893 RepID=A0A9D8KGQ2_9DELT|nr:nitroreductase family protein [Candidatus Zymogenus saltonus]
MTDRGEKTKSPNDLMDVIKVRRSYRKYAGDPIPGDKIGYLKEVVLEGASAFGFKSPFFVFVTRPEGKKLLKRGIFSGLMGKVNPWILTTKAFGFVVCCGYPDSAEVLEDKHFYLAECSILMELLMLAAAEVGVGTCWIGGFGEDGIKRALSIPDNARIVAVTPLGYPPDKIKASSLDYMARSLVSKRRKPMEKIVTMI